VVWPREEGEVTAYFRWLAHTHAMRWNWVALVNQPMTEKEAEGFQISIARNRPYGGEAWQDRQARQLGLLHTLRREGRPKAVTPIN
jgi:hypothetical protein